jgi:hypothetical protein
MVSVARKLSTTQERRKEHNCFGEKTTGTVAKNSKIVLGSNLGEDVVSKDDYDDYGDNNNNSSFL